MGNRDKENPHQLTSQPGTCSTATDRRPPTGSPPPLRLRQEGRSDWTLEAVVCLPCAWHAPCSQVCFLLLEQSFFLSLDSTYCSGLRLRFISSDFILGTCWAPKGLCTCPDPACALLSYMLTTLGFPIASEFCQVSDHICSLQRLNSHAS